MTDKTEQKNGDASAQRKFFGPDGHPLTVRDVINILNGMVERDPTVADRRLKIQVWDAEDNEVMYQRTWCIHQPEDAGDSVVLV